MRSRTMGELGGLPPRAGEGPGRLRTIGKRVQLLGARAGLGKVLRALWAQ